MGQQVVFIILIILGVMIFTQIISMHYFFRKKIKKIMDDMEEIKRNINSNS